MTSWKIVVCVSSMCDTFEPFESEFHDEIPDRILPFVLNGNIVLIVRGMNVHCGRPRVDFANRKIQILGESADSIPEAT